MEYQRILARVLSQRILNTSQRILEDPSGSIREYQRVLGSQNRYLEVPESTTLTESQSSLYRNVYAEEEDNPTIYVLTLL
jgi:hypothetical protein